MPQDSPAGAPPNQSGYPMLTEKDVEGIARLASLSFSPEEIDRMKGQLNSIFANMEKLQALDTQGIEPTAHAVFKPTPLREDEPRPSLSVDEALANAPDRDGAFFVVPRVVG